MIQIGEEVEVAIPGGEATAIVTSVFFRVVKERSTLFVKIQMPGRSKHWVIQASNVQRLAADSNVGRPRITFTAKELAKIRKMHSAGRTQREIAINENISQTTVNRIVRYKNAWAK